MQPENKLIVVMKKIWPFIYKAINVTLYTVLTFLKRNIKLAISMIMEH